MDRDLRFVNAPAVPAGPVRIAVCGLPNLHRTMRRHRPSHLLSLVDPDLPDHALPRGVVAHHLVLRMADVERTSDRGAPTRAQADEILAFGRTMAAGDVIVVHCHGGRCRSTAAALAIVVQALGGPSEGNLAVAREILRQAAPLAMPNGLLAAHLDAALDAGRGAQDRFAKLASEIARSRTIDMFRELDLDPPADAAFGG